jgi:GTP-binding protein HflX
VQRRLPSQRPSLDELQSLAEAAGYTVVDKVEQVRSLDPRFQIGRGKASELADSVTQHRVEKLIFDNELKPRQAYNLAKITGVEAIDRFQLILEIFTRRASTAEAKLQIQLARLRYERARAKERVRLARLEEQPGFMGLGRYEVDLYYETVRRRIRSIRDKLHKIRRKRSLHRARRLELGFPMISLAGYTNAGKSSLFNALAEAAVPADSSLFTTLSTKTSTVVLSGRAVLLTDTVGFIDRLPLKLIEAFRSTLEETIFSDVILLVVDLSEPLDEIERKLSVCLDTIQKIGALGIPIITALNKIDLLEANETLSKTEHLQELAPNPVAISALHNTHTNLLRKEIMNQLEEYVIATFILPMNDESMSFLSWLFNHADVQNVNYQGDRMDISFQSIPWFADKVKERVEELGGTFHASF